MFPASLALCKANVPSRMQQYADRGQLLASVPTLTTSIAAGTRRFARAACQKQKLTNTGGNTWISQIVRIARRNSIVLTQRFKERSDRLMGLRCPVRCTVRQSTSRSIGSCVFSWRATGEESLTILL